MKKVLFFVAAVMLLGSASAQGLQKNIFGVRAGANISNLSINFDEMNMDFKPSFNAGVSYERLLLSSTPLYLETGLYYTNKGAKQGAWEDEDGLYQFSLNYLEVPVMVNYKFHLGNNFALYPSAGLYYAFGVGGSEQEKYKEIDEEGTYIEISKYNVFGADRMLKRSDFGYRVSVSAMWKNIVLTAGYEGSILNTWQDSGDENLSLKMRNSNIFISLGYNF